MKNVSAPRLWAMASAVALISLLTTCKHEDPTPKPVALFTYSPNTNLVAPVTISFQNKSTDATDYLWETSDGETSTAREVNLAIRSGGSVTMTLTVTGKGGTDSYSRTITVANTPVTTTQPVAGFTYSPAQNLVAPATVTFTNTSVNATSYKWDFGDGTTTTDANPVKEFIKAGTFKVKLTAIGKTSSSESTADITLNGTSTVPVADFTYSPATNLTAPVKISFTNTSRNATSYSWNFGDGTTSTSTSPSKDFTKVGDYTVKLTATDAKNQTSQKTVTISVKAPVTQPIADWTWAASNLKVTFTNASKNATSYSWNFGDGATTTASNPTHDYVKAGTYTVTLTASDGKSQNQSSKLVTVTAAPVAMCDWSSALNCAKVVAKKGTRCGEPTSLDVTITNGCTVPVKFYVCIQRSDGTWSGLPDGTFDAGTAPGKSSNWYGCKTTNQYKIGAMTAASFAKNKCSYPKCN